MVRSRSMFVEVEVQTQLVSWSHLRACPNWLLARYPSWRWSLTAFCCDFSFLRTELAMECYLPRSPLCYRQQKSASRLQLIQANSFADYVLPPHGMVISRAAILSRGPWKPVSHHYTADRHINGCLIRTFSRLGRNSLDSSKRLESGPVPLVLKSCWPRLWNLCPPPFFLPKTTRLLLCRAVAKGGGLIVKDPSAEGG